MLQPGGDPDLALESLGPERGRDVRIEHLEGDEPVVLEVARQVDGGHSATPEHALQRVPVA